MPKRRLDTLLTERGLYKSRSQAAAAVLAGDVRVGRARPRTEKPGQLVPDDVELVVAQPSPYVSRGGIKLANGLDELELDPLGRRCLDAGAATGGFTDCLLQRGADAVIALDVSYGELHWKLRQEPRVTVLERTNARHLECEALPYRPDFVVADLSFISLTKALPAVLACTSEAFDALALVKPQFEVGRGQVGKGGVVRDPVARRSALVAVGESVRDHMGLSVLGYASSRLPGPAGNRESFIWFAEPGRAGAVEDLDAAARRAEP